MFLFIRFKLSLNPAIKIKEIKKVVFNRKSIEDKSQVRIWNNAPRFVGAFNVRYSG